ncbi:hypothetical protein [Priestia aryabhattai]|uniref:hypothetical protein n=1 Tax=Priestia aryabhattai TaxID=412384 RepID=UPI0032E87525
MKNNFKEDKTIILNLDGQILMKGIESELVKDGVINGSVVLRLGDSFDIPVNGKLTRVRVDEIQERNLEATSPQERITQYNLIVYNEKKVR